MSAKQSGGSSVRHSKAFCTLDNPRCIHDSLSIVPFMVLQEKEECTSCPSRTKFLPLTSKCIEERTEKLALANNLRRKSDLNLDQPVRKESNADSVTTVKSNERMIDSKLSPSGSKNGSDSESAGTPNERNSDSIRKNLDLKLDPKTIITLDAANLSPIIKFEGNSEVEVSPASLAVRGGVQIDPGKSMTLMLSHGGQHQLITLPTDQLDHRKKYRATFTVRKVETKLQGSPLDTEAKAITEN